MSLRSRVGTLVVGLGPAGLALLSAAEQGGVLDALLDGGLRVVDPVLARAGSGRLGDYAVRSDTAGRVFVEAAYAGAPPRKGPGADLCDRCGTDDPVPLGTAAALLAAAARPVLDRVGAADPDATVAGRVVALQPGPDGTRVVVETATGRSASVAEHVAERVVVANGGRPHVASEVARLAPGAVHSDAVIGRRVPVPDGPVTVVGGSHSAFSAARVLLDADPGRRRPEGWLTLVHRSPVRVTYPDAAAATRDGCAFGPEDVCPQTGRVFRLGGLRGDSAALYRSVRDGEEPRVRLHHGPLAPAHVRGAGLVVAATGYREAVSPLLPGRPGRTSFDPSGALVVDGAPVPGIVGMGLGAGRHRDAGTGGEASFSGRIDGVWFYRNVVAPALLARLG
ncbi:hypothetical protein GCM10022197_13600 [Microlunatus spumicola]|uniref:Uncharacterized protein n=1 Tax=Microlunatus spumicola TaxID=81499 RepID=A0ABP6X098_9ACTN